MREFLANFEQSEYFKQDVRPKIGKNLTPRLRNEIFSVLADIWDPLDVGAGKYQRNEYESYVDDIYNLLVKGATDEQVEDHLDQTARRRMVTKPPRSTPQAVRALRAINLSEDRT
jgi:IS30 family transposase